MNGQTCNMQTEILLVVCLELWLDFHQKFILTFCSSARVHSSGNPGHGYHLPGQEWNGEDSSVCSGHSPAARAN